MLAHRQIKGLAGLVVGLGLIGATSPAGAFSLDGLLTGADNYTASFDLDFLVESKTSDPNTQVSGGILKIGRDGTDGDIFMFLEVPIAIVDNVFGTAAATAGSGWNPPDHPFSKLESSDAFEFKLDVGGTNKFVKVEYIEDDGSVQIKNNDGGILVNAATSLQFNLAQPDGTGFGDILNSPDPIAGLPATAWVQSVQYEFQFDGSQFASGTSFDLADLSMAVLHASPNKLSGDNKVRICGLSDFSTVGGTLCTTTPSTDPPPGNQVPEPTSTALFGFGLLGLWLVRRRQMALVRVAR